MPEQPNMKAVFTIVETRDAKKPVFRRIGTGLVNLDGSINIFLDALPINGKLHVRDLVEEKTDAKE